jgi:hypothetical protein
MIVSDSHRFVFAHVPKTGGISVRAALGPYADGQAAVLQETTHETLPELLSRQPRLAGHFKFAFVRNPWNRLVSFYAYACRYLARTLPQMQGVSFPEMLRLLDGNVAWLRDLFVMRLQSDYTAGADFIGRFERLEDDFKRVCARLNIAAPLARKNASEHGAYSAYYDSWSRGFVADRCARDIDQFGYTFEAA